MTSVVWPRAAEQRVDSWRAPASSGVGADVAWRMARCASVSRASGLE